MGANLAGIRINSFIFINQFGSHMFEIILLSLSWLWTGHSQQHRFEIKFYDNRDSCVKTVYETGIEKVNWADQEYTIKKENFSDVYLSGGGAY